MCLGTAGDAIQRETLSIGLAHEKLPDEYTVSQLCTKSIFTTPSLFLLQQRLKQPSLQNLLTIQ